jgi:DMSO/TMAO reductase YedYZ molybdopterin-dependent catalytic subunit
VIPVFAANGEAFPTVHGYPLRVIVPGWYSSDIIKTDT